MKRSLARRDQVEKPVPGSLSWLDKMRTRMVYFLSAEVCHGAYLIKIHTVHIDWFSQWYVRICPKNYKRDAQTNWILVREFFCCCYCLFVPCRWNLSSWVHDPLLIIGACQAVLCFYFPLLFPIPLFHSLLPHVQLQFCIWCLCFFLMYVFIKCLLFCCMYF